jgi:GNAT superfamily N-acetyltransferase
MASIHIRPAAPADAELIFALVTELAAYEKLSAAVDATADSLAQALFNSAPRVFCDVASYDGETVGLAIWFYTFSTFRGRHGIWLEDLYVRPAFRGRGIGKALVARLAARCVGENLARLEWSVLDWNLPSIAFYKAMGAVMMDEWTNCRCEGDALHRLATRAAGNTDALRV